MTSFTSLLVTPLVSYSASKMNYGQLKKENFYQLTTETVNCKTVNPLMPGGNKKVTNRLFAGLFKYV